MNKNLQISNTTTSSVVESLVYEVLSKIPSYTGPTGPVANQGILTSEGIMLSSIIPESNNLYDIGNEVSKLGKVYTKKMVVDNLEIEKISGHLNLPAGSMIGNVSVGTIKINGKKTNVSELPVVGVLEGDSYLIESNLWVYSSDNNWVDIGVIEGPQGSKVYT